MAFIQYLKFDGTPLPLPDSYEVQMADVVVKLFCNTYG